jgi:hypothetical protein
MHIEPSDLDFKTAAAIARGAAGISRHPWLVIKDTDGSFFAVPIDDDPDYGQVVYIAAPPP